MHLMMAYANGRDMQCKPDILCPSLYKLLFSSQLAYQILLGSKSQFWGGLRDLLLHDLNLK